MINFYINGKRAILPSKFKFKIFDENQFLTQRGQFSLDITLSLLNKTNAKIFNHINRLNNSNLIKSAEAVFDTNGTIYKGKIIDIENTDKSVTFQFVAGNSEINWFGTDKKIWDYDWGAETEVNFDKAKFTINNPGFGEVRSNRPPYDLIGFNNYVCPPIVCSGTESEITLNKLKYDDEFDSFVNLTDIENITIQPYLLYYINKLPQLFGYTMKTNILDSDIRAKKMYIINTINSLNYSDFLPDLTVSEFISTIETFFNVIFQFDSLDKTLSIIRLSDFIDNGTYEDIYNSVDSYERKYIDENVIKNIKYKELPSTYFYKYQNLPEDVLTKITFMHFENWAAIYSYFSTGNLYVNLNKPIIFVDDELEEHWMFAYPESFRFYERTIGWGTRSLTLINKYRDYVIDETASASIELNICPCSMTTCIIIAKYKVGTVNSTLEIPIQAPYASSNSFKDETQKIIDLIENGINKLPRLSKLECAFFVGNNAINSSGIIISYPISCIDDRFDVYHSVNDGDQDVYIANATGLTFRINGANGIKQAYYPTNNLIAYDNEYIIKYVDNPNINSSKLVMHRNIKYIIKSLEKDIDSTSKKSIVTGTFLKIIN